MGQLGTARHSSRLTAKLEMVSWVSRTALLNTNKMGACPAGGVHDSNGSGPYAALFGEDAPANREAEDIAIRGRAARKQPWLRILAQAPQ